METNYNIYERIDLIEKELISLRKKIDNYESNLIQEGHNEIKINNKDLVGSYTILDILLVYKISRQTLYNYRKLVTLKKSGRIGRFDRFKKKNVVEFMNKVAELKHTNPELFKGPSFLEKK